MILLVRHGETEWNREGRMQGQGDSPLTAKGVQQAHELAALLARIIPAGQTATLVSSPLGRARSTAEIIFQTLGPQISDFRVEPLLKELDVGLWSGLSRDDVCARFPGQWEARMENRWSYCIDGGESYAMGFARAQSWLATLNENKIVIAVSHEMISRTILGSYLQMTPQVFLTQKLPHGRVCILSRGSMRFEPPPPAGNEAR